MLKATQTLLKLFSIHLFYRSAFSTGSPNRFPQRNGATQGKGDILKGGVVAMAKVKVTTKVTVRVTVKRRVLVRK